MTQRALHQLSHAIGRHDAVSDHVFLLRSWLRELGFESEIFAPHITPDVQDEVRPLSQFRPARGEFVLYHHSIGSPLVDDLTGWGVQVIPVYHNITPAEFFTAIDPQLAGFTAHGRAQLHQLKKISPLALPVSAYNQLELDEAGFRRTIVLPLTFDAAAYDVPLNPELPAARRKQADGAPLLLFVGRISPHKRQEDLLKLLQAYRRIEPHARLALVGGRWMQPYVAWLEDLIDHFDLREAVDMPGLVSQSDLVTYFRTADLYVSMSEHEGVGKPFLESMHLELPILAYAATATPYTLGETGVLFHRKDYPRLAEVVDMLVRDEPLRRRLIARQKERIATFSAAAVKQIFVEALAAAGLR